MRAALAAMIPKATNKLSREGRATAQARAARLSAVATTAAVRMMEARSKPGTCRQRRVSTKRRVYRPARIRLPAAARAKRARKRGDRTRISQPRNQMTTGMPNASNPSSAARVWTAATRAGSSTLASRRSSRYSASSEPRYRSACVAAGHSERPARGRVFAGAPAYPARRLRNAGSIWGKRKRTVPSDRALSKAAAARTCMTAGRRLERSGMVPFGGAIRPPRAPSPVPARSAIQNIP